MTSRRIAAVALISACAWVGLAAVAYAQQQTGAAKPVDPLNTNCYATFSNGANQNLFRICLSRHGNLVRLESPLGSEHIRQGTFVEGYSLCTNGNVSGYDLGALESGFNNGTVSQPGGPGTLPLIVTRNTTDGLFQLKQTIDWDPSNKQVEIEMALKNVSGGQLTDVAVHRIVDFDVDGVFDNRWGIAYNSVFAWNDFFDAGSAGHAVSLTAPTESFFHFPSVQSFIDDPSCFPDSEITPTQGDFAGRVTYTLGNIGNGTTRTVDVVYRRF